MAENKVIFGLYNDDEVLVKGVESIRGKGVHVNNAYTPFAVHGLDKALGMQWTRLAICSFLYGITGTSLALFGMWYFHIFDWPLNIGGKPSFSLHENMLSFIPITFEFTVLCAGHGMAITFLFRSWVLPGVKATNPDPRTTDDHFALEIHTAENGGKSESDIKEILKKSGAVEVWAKGEKR